MQTQCSYCLQALSKGNERIQWVGDVREAVVVRTAVQRLDSLTHNFGKTRKFSWALEKGGLDGDFPRENYWNFWLGKGWADQFSLLLCPFLCQGGPSLCGMFPTDQLFNPPVISILFFIVFSSPSTRF